jgi:hypothetical protein
MQRCHCGAAPKLRSLDPTPTRRRICSAITPPPPATLSPPLPLCAPRLMFPTPAAAPTFSARATRNSTPPLPPSPALRLPSSSWASGQPPSPSLLSLPQTSTLSPPVCRLTPHPQVEVLPRSADVEREAQDRTDVTLPGLQGELIRRCVATGTPVVVVFVHGASVVDEVPSREGGVEPSVL